MIRIAFLITGLERGGAELQLLHLARALSTRGWDVAVFYLCGGSLLGEFRAHRIRVYPFRLAALFRFRPHILHAHLFHANVSARLTRLLLPIPVVISTIHSMAETGRRSIAIRHRDLLYRITDLLSDANVFVSHAAADRHRLSRARIIPNGVDTGCFRPDPERRVRTRTALGIDGEFCWLAAGRLMWKKNYPLMLEAIAQQPGAILWIAGEGPDEALLRGAAPPNVRFLGPRTDIPDLMNAADAFVLSSVVEGLPMVLVEAAASGLPCVATSVGGVPEAVIDGTTGFLVPADNSIALAAAMSRLIVSDRTAMSRAARELALDRFDLQKVLAKWESLYRELLWM